MRFLQYLEVQRLFRYPLLQTEVLLQRLQPLRIADFHVPVLRLPALERPLGYAALAQRVRRPRSASASFRIPMICSSLNRFLLWPVLCPLSTLQGSH